MYSVILYFVGSCRPKIRQWTGCLFRYHFPLAHSSPCRHAPISTIFFILYFLSVLNASVYCADLYVSFRIQMIKMVQPHLLVVYFPNSPNIAIYNIRPRKVKTEERFKCESFASELYAHLE